jgi:DNA-binding NarL/FixJ family response regulator
VLHHQARPWDHAGTSRARTHQQGREPELEPIAIPRSPGSRRPEALTPRQHEVLDLLVQGKSTAGMAEAMGLAASTVRVHLIGVFRVLGVSSRSQAVLAASQRVRTQHHPGGAVSLS